MQGHAAQAIEYAWLFVEGIEDLTAEEEAEAYEAVATTLRMIEKLAAAPRGIVLVNADDDHVYGLGKDAAAACRNANEGYGADLAWEQVGPGEFRNARDAGRYVAYEIALLDWSAEDGDFVRAVGDLAGYWMARSVLDDAA